MSHIVRFTVKFDNEELRLFYIREATDGSLIFIPPSSKIAFGNSELIGVNDYHFTAHVPNQTKGDKFGLRHIKESFLTTDSNYASRSIYVRPRSPAGAPFLFPLASVIGGKIGLQSHFKKKPGKEEIKLISYSGNDAICYSVFVSTIGLRMPAVQGFSKVETCFSKQKITVYMSFIPSGSLPFSIIATNGTAPLRAKGEPEPPIAKKSPMSIKNMDAFLYGQHELIFEAYHSACDTEARRFDPYFVSAPSSAIPKLRWPSSQTLQDMSYGVLSRLTNEVYINKRFTDGGLKSAGEFAKFKLASERHVLELIDREPIESIQCLIKTPGILPLYKDRMQSILEAN